MRAHVLAIAFLLTLGCGTSDPDDGDWQVVFEDRAAALLSVWGRSSSDVWLVGADPEQGNGPDILHFDGESFTQLNSEANGDLWWVSGTADAVWMSGEDGLLLRYAQGTFEAVEVPTDATLFGVLPFADDDVWVVGGDAENNRGVLLHYDGAAWSEPEGLPADALTAGQLFKIWGTSSDALWVVGLGGLALHFDGTDWTRIAVPDGRRLFTVHGDPNANEVVAVGGFIDGLIVDFANNTVNDATPADLLQQNGIWVTPEGRTITVGTQGSVWERDGAEFRKLATRRTSLDHHAVYVDELGSIWAVGGFIVSSPLRKGFVYRQGAPISAEIR